MILDTPERLANAILSLRNAHLKQITTGEDEATLTYEGVVGYYHLTFQKGIEAKLTGPGIEE